MVTAPARGTTLRVALVACAAALLGASVSTTAVAEVVSGTCTGTVTIDDAVVLDADQPRDAAVEVPTTGSFVFVGSIERDAGEEAPVPFSGELRLLLPVGSVALEEWSGQTTDAEVVASGGYVLPGVLPGGTGPIPFEVLHIAGGDVCRVVVSVTTPGSTWDTITIGLLVVTLLLVAAMFAAGRQDARGRGRPLVGLLAGLLGGLTGAATLFGAAPIALDSPVWWVLPLVLAALGLLSGTAAPFGAERDGETSEADRPGPDAGSRGGPGSPPGPEAPEGPSSSDGDAG